MGGAPQPTAWRRSELYSSKGKRPGPSRHHDRWWTFVGVIVAVAVAGAAFYFSGMPGRTTAANHHQGPPPGLEEGSASHPPAVLPGPGAHRFSANQPDGTPVTFSPCRPIHYVVRPDHAPANGDRMISAAVAELSRATGLRFIADGRTSEPIVQDRPPYQRDRYGNRWAPVLIAWVTPDEDPDFGVDFAGTAGPQRLTSQGGRSVYVTGELHLSGTSITQMKNSLGEAAARSVILHELGHLVGLAHVNDPTQIMFPRVQPGVTTFGLGDLRGLAKLGSGRCVPEV